MWTIIGYLAATISAISLTPEIIKASRTHHLQDVSWIMLSLMFSSSLLWTLYGINLQDIPLILSSAVNLSMNIALMTMKRQYDLTGKPLFSFFRKKKEEKEEKMEPALETEPAQSENNNS